MESKNPPSQILVVVNANKEREQNFFFEKLLPIITQEDPYMICLLGRQKYIDIVKTIVIGWVEGVNLFFFSFLLLNLLVSIV
jgi:hypothetical protein